MATELLGCRVGVGMTTRLPLIHEGISGHDQENPVRLQWFPTSSSLGLSSHYTAWPSFANYCRARSDAMNRGKSTRSAVAYFVLVHGWPDHALDCSSPLCELPDFRRRLADLQANLRKQGCCLL
jgi:hypothetical protein